MDSDKADRARFEELLPFYVNEMVSDVDRKWVESYLAVQLTAASSLQFERSLQQVVLQTRSSVPHQQRLERVLFESGLKPKKRSWLNRLFIVTSAEDVAAHWRRIAIPVPMFALATALFIGQVAFIGLNVIASTNLTCLLKFRDRVRHPKNSIWRGMRLMSLCQ